MEFLSYLISGLSLGSVYAIIALGYTMVYGIAKMLNFAHGDVIMVGGYISYIAMARAGLPGWLSVIIAMAVCTVLGVVIEGLAYRPLRSATSLAVLITAIGVSYFLQNAALLIWGANFKTYPSLISGTLKLSLGEDRQLSIPYVAMLTIVVCILIMVGLTLFTSKTKMGKAMRACSEDKGAAQLMGINVNKTISVTFAIGSALAAIAGVLLCSSFPTLKPTTGSMPGIKAFTAAVFGGIGSIPGAVIGAFIIGICENIIKGLGLTTFSDAFTFVLLIVILMVKPTGIFGEKATDKV
jgi:branched-chain amino acid transport system permease protein